MENINEHCEVWHVVALISYLQSLRQTVAYVSIG